MNTTERNEAIKTEISNIVSEFRSSIRHSRQYPMAKWQSEKLAELGLSEYLPAGIQHGDAGEIIKAAENNGGGAFNAYGEGEEWRGSKLNQLLNTPADTDEPQEPNVATNNNDVLEVVVKITIEQPDYEILEDRVRLVGWNRLTPRAARAALQVATGRNYDGEVWFFSPDGNDYGYRVYKNSARKLYAEW